MANADLSRPVLLLDVDGVVNKVRDDPDPEGFRDFQEALCKGSQIRYSPKMAERIAALEVDLHWLTTWCDDANEHISPLLKVGVLPVVGMEVLRGYLGRGWWKSVAAEEFVVKLGRPFIWVDDDLWAAERNDEVPWLVECEIPHLCIAPDTFRGLLPRHLDQIEAWINELEN